MIESLDLVVKELNMKSKGLLMDDTLLSHGSKTVRKVKEMYDDCMNDDDIHVYSVVEEILVEKLLKLNDQLNTNNISSTFKQIQGIQLEATRLRGLLHLKKEDQCDFIFEDKFPYVFDRLFIDKYSVVEDVDAARHLFDSIKTTIEQDTEIDWVSQKSLNSIQKGLRRTRYNIGFPDWILEDDQLDREYRGGSKHKEWGMNIRQVNAEFRWGFKGIKADKQEITVPVGILSRHMFNSNVPSHVNYGAAGFVSGHELSHGVQFWIKRVEKDTVHEKEMCIQGQLEEVVEPQTGLSYLNARLVSAEAVADVAAINASFNSWMKTRDHESLPGLSAFTPEQLFFISFANIWCFNAKDDRIRKELSTPSDHPFNYHRVIISVINSPDFSNAFHCKPTSKMNPLQKCIVW